jgi:hypothetical protein
MRQSNTERFLFEAQAGGGLVFGNAASGGSRKRW